MASGPDSISLLSTPSEDGSSAHVNSKLKGIFTVALKQVQKQVHPTLTAKDDAVDYIEQLIVRLLAMLCQSKPHTIQDVIEQVSQTFPNPIDKWAKQDADQALEKKKKDRKTGEKGVTLPADKVHPLLKEMLGYKIEQQVSLYIVAVLEYVAADIWKLAGIYVKNIKLPEITCQDVKVAMAVDKVLMNMFFPDDDDLSLKAAEPESPKLYRQRSMSYEEFVKDLILEETQYIRELNMIIKVFRAPFVELFPRSKDLDVIFSNIVDIHEFTVDFLGSVEDVLEMTEQNEMPLIGGCFEEMAEAAEFDVYENYMEDIVKPNMRDRLNTLLQREDTVARLQAVADGFKDAVKYVLPRLLLGPISHLQHYFEIIKLLKDSTPDEDDQESFQQAEGLLHSLRIEVERKMLTMTASNSTATKRRPSESWHQSGHRGGRQSALALIAELQKSIDGWEGKDIDQCCNEYIMEGVLMKHQNRKATERYVFLLDGLIIFCKQNTRKSTSVQQDYRLKDKYSMRRIDIIDREDNEELKNAFEVHAHEQVVAVLTARSADEKSAWMAALLSLLSRSTLERALDAVLSQEERAQPLLLPPAAEYEFAVDDTDDNIVLAESSSGAAASVLVASPGGGPPLIRGATLAKLVERLTYHMYADPKFVRVFLTTYRSFCAPHELLELLMRRFRIPPETAIPPPPAAPGTVGCGGAADGGEQALAAYREGLIRFRKGYCKPVQFRVLNVIRHWADHHYYDFERDAGLLRKLEDFLDSIKSKAMQKWVESILNTIKRKQDSASAPEAVFNKEPPVVEWHITKDPENFDILTLHPIEIARQVTLLEFDLYRAVRPSELVGSVWTKEDKWHTSPNLMQLIHHTTRFTFWMEKSIVETKNAEERVAVVSRIIEVMMVLHELNNFNGVLEVVSALDSASIYRLQHTFDKLQGMHKKAFEEAKELSSDHFKKYIDKLRSINPPCVPFFGMYLTNILMTEEGNPDFLPKAPGLINFNKRRKVAEITGEIQQYQNQPYNLQAVSDIRSYLQKLDPFEGRTQHEFEDYLYEMSLEIEPRNAKPAKFPRKYEHSTKSPGIKPAAPGAAPSGASSSSNRQSSFAALRNHLSPFTSSPSLDSIPLSTKGAFPFKAPQDDDECSVMSAFVGIGGGGVCDTPPTPSTPKTPPSGHTSAVNSTTGAVRVDADVGGGVTAVLPQLAQPPLGRHSSRASAPPSSAAFSLPPPTGGTAAVVTRPPPLPPRRLKSLSGPTLGAVMQVSAPAGHLEAAALVVDPPPPALPPKPKDRDIVPVTPTAPTEHVPPLPPRRPPKPYLSRHSVPHVERHTARRNSGEHVNINGLLVTASPSSSATPPAGPTTPQLPPRTYKHNHARQKSQ